MSKCKTIKIQGLREELVDLLSEDFNNARFRSENEFDIISNGKRDIILFGAGGLGRKILAGIRLKGIEPIAISDNNNEIWGTKIDGIPVVSPQEAASRFGQSSVFVVTIWRAGGGHRFENTASQLRSLGCDKVVSFIPLMWKFHDSFLPYYCIDLPEKLLTDSIRIIDAFDLLEDEYSCREYLNQIRFRIQGDISGLDSPISDEHYFPKDILQLNRNEVFVDCGAFDGDVIKSILKLCPKFNGTIFAFEPDPQINKELISYINSQSHSLSKRIKVFSLGIGLKNERVRFLIENNGGSAINSQGPMSIDLISLDKHLENEKTPTFIKMDIEGAELDAIKGAEQIIKKHSPILAISSYHKPNDLWEIPNNINILNDEYKYFLRPHNTEGWDLVTYAIPKNRLKLNNN